MKLSVQIKNLNPVIFRLRAFSPAVRRAIKATVGEYAAKEYSMAYDLCPKDTFFMADHIRTEFTESGYGYYIGWKRSDFLAAGKKRFYCWDQEFGFKHYITGQKIQNPCLLPTRRVMGPRFERALARVLREAAAGRTSARFRSAKIGGGARRVG